MVPDPEMRKEAILSTTEDFDLYIIDNSQGCISRSEIIIWTKNGMGKSKKLAFGETISSLKFRPLFSLNCMSRISESFSPTFFTCEIGFVQI